MRHRTLSPEQLARWVPKLEEFNDEVAAFLKEEKEEKAIHQAQMEPKKGENMIEHEQVIFSRPAQMSFQSEKGKLNAKNALVMS